MSEAGGANAVGGDPLEPQSSAVRLVVKELVVGFGGRPLLPPVSQQFGAGSVWAIVGPNGAGKTTFVRTLLGLLKPVSGTVVRGPALRVSYTSQRNDLDQSVPARVIDVVRGGLDRGWAFAVPGATWFGASRKRVIAAMRDTDTLQLQSQSFATLSEGQKQRVVIARALASTPTVLVLDEPSSAMDISSERAMLKLITTIAQQRGLAVLIVTHHLRIAAEFVSHVLFFDRATQTVSAGSRAAVACDPAVRAVFGNALAHTDDVVTGVAQ